MIFELYLKRCFLICISAWTRSFCEKLLSVSRLLDLLPSVTCMLPTFQGLYLKKKQVYLTNSSLYGSPNEALI